MNTRKLWKIITAVELVAAAAVILFDLFLPTLILLGLALVSLLIRREPVAALGFKRPAS